jgi:hypothetical protein
MMVIFHEGRDWNEQNTYLKFPLRKIKLKIIFIFLEEKNLTIIAKGHFLC